MARYTLPIARTDILGGVKVGDDFTISADGTLNIKGMDQMRQTVSELPAQVAAGKAQIAAAITEKGVDTTADATFSSMAENIIRIAGGVSYDSLFNNNGLHSYTLEEG